ncbi:interferon gamma receptor 2 isoform X2 [Myripristis murdjan]|uniref:interferon gamma receptor 2 isoform X2 n=1 Tax=Myripristis murdjan TaxID=586833 RepID=UPI0011760C31|nr:uncharacterized protein LOC115379492 isoform X2 [Myripristis murdjan]
MTLLEMLAVLLWAQLFSQVWSEHLPPPQEVHIDSVLLTWTPAPDQRNVTYTVESRSFDSYKYDVSACVRTQLNTCDVTSVKAEARHGCVELRVRAERDGLTSEPLEACSRQGDSCSPSVQLSPRPGSLTVNLSSNHSLVEDYAANVKQIVFYGKDGESLQEYERSISSVVIRDLEEGVRYCVKVQFAVHEKFMGPPSCRLCEVIPHSDSTETKIAAGLAGALILVIVIVAFSYIIIFERERIKRWLQPPYTMPRCILQPLPEHHPISVSSPSEERCDEITFIFREEESPSSSLRA